MAITISVVVFTCVRLLPSSPAEILLMTYGLPNTPENIARLQVQWGLDAPILVQYVRWFSHFLKGDWGISYMSKKPVFDELLVRGRYSLLIGMGGVVAASVSSFFMGYLAALKKNGLVDHFTRLCSLLVQTIPSFVMTIMIIYVLGVKMKMVRFFTGDGRISMSLACFVVAFYAFGEMARLVRSRFREIMSETYVVAAISRGFHPAYVLIREGYKPVLFSLLAAVQSKMAWVIGGTAVVEIAFGIPGVSQFLVESIKYRDYNVIQSYILFMAAWMFFVHHGVGGVLKLLDASVKLRRAGM